MRRFLALSTAAVAMLAAGCEEGVTTASHVACDPFLTTFQGVTGDTLQSAIGASYVDVRTGSGQVADLNSSIDVNYTLYDLDLNRLDSSCPVDRTVIRFVLGTNQILPGFQDGIRGMRVGGLRRVILPEDLGYPALPDNSNEAVADKVLVFDVELVAVRR